MINGRENLQYSHKFPFRCYFAKYKSHSDCPELTPCLYIGINVTYVVHKVNVISFMFCNSTTELSKLLPSLLKTLNSYLSTLTLNLLREVNSPDLVWPSRIG
jgi:hypothetical protein